MLDAGDEVVALICNQRQWGRHSGIETEVPPYGLVFTIRDGRVMRWRGVSDQESALKAAGLSGYPVSSASVELVRAFLVAWNAGDMDAVRELWHPDAIVRPASGWPEPGPFIGRDAIMRAFEQLREAWETDTVETTGDVIEAADHVVARTVWRGEGHGPDLDMQITQVFTVRKGRIFGMESFWDHDEALEAVGLKE